MQLTTRKVHLIAEALIQERNRFQRLIDDAVAAPLTPGSPHIPSGTVEVWRVHVSELDALRHEVLKADRPQAA